MAPSLEGQFVNASSFGVLENKLILTDKLLAERDAIRELYIPKENDIKISKTDRIRLMNEFWTK
ncbi:MAG: hypothetical protein MHPSP_004459, partial [Paramarteilia canceri]